MISSNNRTNMHIDIYNDLTSIQSENEEELSELNFLKSIKYKMPNGNILLGFLIMLTEKNINFKILKGFNIYEENYDKFERCLIESKDEIPEMENIQITKVEDNLYEISLEGGLQ